MGRSQRLTVALVDDHALFTRGLSLLLSADPLRRLEVVGTTDRAAMAVDLVRRTSPDVALIDLGMPPPGGMEAIRAIARAEPGVGILALSGLDDAALAVTALAAGANGYLSKASDPEALFAPLLAVAEGATVLAPFVTEHLVASARRPTTEALADLTPEDLELWRHVARGASTDEIARRMLVSERTAKRLVATLLRRVGAGNRVEAAALAGRAGLLDGPEVGPTRRRRAGLA